MSCIFPLNLWQNFPKQQPRQTLERNKMTKSEHAFGFIFMFDNMVIIVYNIFRNQTPAHHENAEENNREQNRQHLRICR